MLYELKNYNMWNIYLGSFSNQKERWLRANQRTYALDFECRNGARYWRLVFFLQKHDIRLVAARVCGYHFRKPKLLIIYVIITKYVMDFIRNVSGLYKKTCVYVYLSMKTPAPKHALSLEWSARELFFGIEHTCVYKTMHVSFLLSKWSLPCTLKSSDDTLTYTVFAS